MGQLELRYELAAMCADRYVDADLRGRTPRRGLWVDNTELTVDQTVQHILDNKHHAIC